MCSPGLEQVSRLSWRFTRHGHDLHELLEGKGGWRSRTLLIGQEDFDRLTQEFLLSWEGMKISSANCFSHREKMPSQVAHRSLNVGKSCLRTLG